MALRFAMELLQKTALLSIQRLNGTGDLRGDGLVLRSLALKSGSPCAGFYAGSLARPTRWREFARRAFTMSTAPGRRSLAHSSPAENRSIVVRFWTCGSIEFRGANIDASPDCGYDPKEAAQRLGQVIRPGPLGRGPDIDKFFDSVDHQRLLDRLAAGGVDPEGCELIRNWRAAG